MSLTRCIGMLAGSLIVGTTFAFPIEDPVGDTSTAQMQEQINRLQKSLEQVQGENKANKEELSELKSQNGDKWLTQERAAQIRDVVQDVLADSETRTSLQYSGATAGYDKGFFLASPDGNFRLVVGGQFQTRYAVSRLSNSSLNGWNKATNNPSTPKVDRTAYGFEIRRMKVEFSGNVIDPSWTYKVTAIYNSTYNQALAAVSPTATNAGPGAGTATASLEDAWINKDFSDGLSLKMGQFKSPFNREELVSSKYQLCVERSLVNQLFSAKFTQGVAFTAKGDNLMGTICYNDGGNNANESALEGNQSNSAGYALYALTGRVQYLAFGNWKQFDSLTSIRGDAQGLMFGGAFNYQQGGVTIANTPTTAVNGDGNVTMFSYTADAQWMLGGANIFGSFFGNAANNIAGASLPATDVGSSVFTYGATLQAGYYLTDDVEAFARFEWYDTLNNGSNGQPHEAPTLVSVALIPSSPFYAQHNTIYTVGLNWYIAGKQVKFTTDLGYSVNGVMFTNGMYSQSITGADYRQDSSVGNGGQFVFRTQMQLLF